LNIQLWVVNKSARYISSPEPGDAPANQIIIRESDPNAVGYSTILVRAWWWDGVARVLCAYSGDPRTSAPYEPAPADSSNCDKPRDSVAGICDNKEDFSANGAGSFVVANGGYNYCFPLGCGKDEQSACEIELRISNRYAGDNYKVYFEYEDEIAQQTVIQATANITAWKHIHIEKDKMCRRGGIIYETNALNATSIKIAKFNGQRVDDIVENEKLKIFDLQQKGEIAC